MRFHVPTVAHRFIEVDGVRVFFREAGPPGAPALLLLHGFPSASHQFRRLIDALGHDFRLVAPDYPGFGHSDTPRAVRDGGRFEYSFERLTDVMEGFCERLGLDRFAVYMFDFGGPVGLRLAMRRPEWIAGLIIQNANAYEEGLSPIARRLIWALDGDEQARDTVRRLLSLGGIREQYVGGAHEPEAIPPDGWILDHHLVDQPGREQLQIDLTFDYRSNVELYPAWQAWLREHRPPALILWGRDDPFFVEPGARAYLRDLPDAELHMLDAGHFALEERLGEIATLIASFVGRIWDRPGTEAAEEAA